MKEKVYVLLYHTYDYYEFTDFHCIRKTQELCLDEVKEGSKVALSKDSHNKYRDNEECHYYIFESYL